MNWTQCPKCKRRTCTPSTHECEKPRSELEAENARLRAIFPRILEALQSGACAPDCSVEFFEMIPNEVAGVMRKLRLPNAGSEPHGQPEKL